MRCDFTKGLLSKVAAGVAILVVAVGVSATAVGDGGYLATCEDGAGGAVTCKSASNPRAVCGADGAGQQGADCDNTRDDCTCVTVTNGCRCF